MQARDIFWLKLTLALSVFLGLGLAMGTQYFIWMIMDHPTQQSNPWHLVIGAFVYTFAGVWIIYGLLRWAFSPVVIAIIRALKSNKSTSP